MPAHPRIDWDIDMFVPFVQALPRLSTRDALCWRMNDNFDQTFDFFDASKCRNKSPLKSIKCFSAPGTNWCRVLRTKDHEITLNPQLLFKSEVHRALNWNSFSVASFGILFTLVPKRQSETRFKRRFSLQTDWCNTKFFLWLSHEGNLIAKDIVN